MTRQIRDTNASIDVNTIMNFTDNMRLSSDTRSSMEISNLSKNSFIFNTTMGTEDGTKQPIQSFTLAFKLWQWTPLKTHVKISLKSGEIQWNL